MLLHLLFEQADGLGQGLFVHGAIIGLGGLVGTQGRLGGGIIINAINDVLDAFGHGAGLDSAIQTGQNMGMQTLDQCLADLVRRNVVASAEARIKAQNKDSFPV